jgi:hypothetical protein
MEAFTPRCQCQEWRISSDLTSLGINPDDSLLDELFIAVTSSNTSSALLAGIASRSFRIVVVVNPVIM